MTVQRDACPERHLSCRRMGSLACFYAEPNGPYSPEYTHQGIDIFSNAEPGVMPVYAAYDGFIYRESTGAAP